MDFKYIRQPEFSFEFRAYDKVTEQLVDILGFDDEQVFAVIGGEITPLERADCVIDQWTGLLDQEEKKILTNDVVEVCNSFGRPVGLFIVRYNNREGRYILDGVTRGAHISRLTQWQNCRVVGNIHDKNYDVRRYAHA
nr:MAG TPA: YopX protein [Caudoviricetes sp.]